MIKEKCIDVVINEFDFESIIVIMRATEWKWFVERDGRVTDEYPKHNELVGTAKKRLSEALEQFSVNRKFGASASGGFHAECDECGLSLCFIANSSESGSEFHEFLDDLPIECKESDHTEEHI